MPLPPTARLVSIGYEGRDLGDLVARLEAERVRCLVDVRLNAISRKPGLSKTRLAASLGAGGISYVHHRELGNPQDNRVAYRNGDAGARQRFRTLLTSAAAGAALEHVIELLEDRTVALLCFERDHTSCHRTLVAEAVVARVPGVDVVDI